MLGEKVYTSIALNNQAEMGVAVMLDVPAGVYFVTVSDGQKLFTQKLIVQ